MSDVPSEKWAIFLNHNSKDKPLVEELARRLLERGIRPWFDKWDLVPGQEWLPAVTRAVQEISCMAVCIGPAGWGPVQDSEMQNAQYLAMRVPQRRVIPILLPGAEKPELRGLLENRTWIDLRTHAAEEFERLCSAIHGKAPGPGPRSSSECPYRGLQAFERTHAPMFFGRARQAAELLDKLRRSQRLLLVVGPSGSGKSSLVLAGLVPGVITGQLNGSYDWRVVTLRPGARPCHALALALGQIEPKTSQPIDATHLQKRRSRLLNSPEALADHADVALSDEPRSPRLLLVVDQLEELFSQCQDTTDREAFLGNLLHAATAAGGRVHVVATLRSDFLGRCQEQTGLAEHLNSANFLVSPLTEADLRETVNRPAELYGLRFEPGLADALVTAVRAQPGNLPLLQFTLLQLWKERAGNELTWEGYRRIGELRRAIARSAEQVFAELTEPQQQAARRAFSRLVIVGEGTGDTRRRASRAELAEVGTEVSSVLEQFITERLLVADEEFVELAHEALVHGWERLRGWLDADREALLLRQEVARATGVWERSGRTADELWRGTRLARARELQTMLEPLLTKEERLFIHESIQALQKAEEAAEAQRRRETELTQLALARMLAMRSAQVQPRDPMLSLLLAQEAVRHRSNDETRSELYVALLGSPQRKRIPLKGGRPPTPYFRLSPDGRTLLVFLGPEIALLSSDGTLLAKLPVASHDIRLANFSPDGKTVALIPNLGFKKRSVAAWLFNLRGELVSTLVDDGDKEPASCANFSQDGQALLTSRTDGMVRLWRRDGKLVAQARIGGAWPYGYFSPDGTRILLVASENPIAALWSGQDGQILELHGHEHRIIGGDWSPDSKHALTVARDHTARIWDRDGNLLATLSGHTAPLSSGEFSPSGERVLTASEDRTARVWELSGKTQRLLDDSPTALRQGSWSPSGRHLLTETSDGTVRVYRADGKLLTTLWGKEQVIFPESSFPTWSPDGASLLTSRTEHGSDESWIDVWAVEPEPALALQGHPSEIQSVAPQPRGTRLLTVSYDCVCLWDGQGAQLRRIEPESHHDETGKIRGFKNACWAPGGERFLTYAFGGLVRLWDGDGHFLHALQGAEQHQGDIRHACFSPDGTHILTVSNDGSGRLWNMEGREVARMGEHYWGVEYGEFAQAGDRALTVNAHAEVFIWDLKAPFPEINDPYRPFGMHRHENSGPDQPPKVVIVGTLGEAGPAPKHVKLPPKPIAPYRAARLLYHREKGFPEHIYGAHFLPGGTELLLSARGVPCESIEPGEREEPRFLAPERDIAFCSLNPEGTRIYLGFEDGDAEVRSPSGEVLLHLRGHEKAVRKMGSTPDGSCLFTAATDGTICLWTSDGSRLATLRGHLDTLRDVAFLGDGQTLVTASGSVAWLWPVTEKGLLELARRRTLRDLSLEERERYLL